MITLLTWNSCTSSSRRSTKWAPNLQYRDKIPEQYWMKTPNLSPSNVSLMYFLCRDVPPDRVSFSGSSVLNRVCNFTFLCLKQGRPHNSFIPPSTLNHIIVADFVCLRWDEWNTNLCVPNTGGGGGSTPYDRLYGEAPPERGLFLRSRYKKGIGK